VKTATDWSIRYPRPLLDKLGVRPAARVTVMRIEDQGFLQRLAERTTDVSPRVRKNSDLILYGARAPKDLGRLAALRQTIKPAGAIWVVRAKGDKAAIRETDIIAAAKSQGLVDVKVVSFSETHSALKLVIPVALR
jgi:hypothetical protein